MTKRRETFERDGDRLYLFFKGRVALYALLDAMSVGPGDEVVLPAYTCVVVPNAILYKGAKPVYVDIDLPTYSANPGRIEAALTDRTKAVICQNTYGLSANVDSIVEMCKSRGIRTIEDCTHGYGGTYKGKPNGSWCDAAFYSSQWNKPFSSGVGGYARVNDPGIEEQISRFVSGLPAPSIKIQAMLWTLMRVRALISPATYYAFVDAYRYLSKRNLVTGSSSGEELASTTMPGDYLQGMSGVQYKAALRGMARLPEVNARRKEAGRMYTEYLSSIGKNHVAPELHADHLFLKYPVLVRDREAFMDRAKAARIPLGDWFRSALHPIEHDLERWGFDGALFPNAVFAAAHVVNIPTDTKDPGRVLGFLSKNKDEILQAGEGR